MTSREPLRRDFNFRYDRLEILLAPLVLISLISPSLHTADGDQVRHDIKRTFKKRLQFSL